MMKDFNFYCKDILEAIKICLKNGKDNPSLILLYSGIDIMAWLDLPQDRIETTRDDFISWVDKYLLPESGLECTAIDLYAARCGILHSYSFFSRLSKIKKAKKIYYSTGKANNEFLKNRIPDGENAVAVHIAELYVAFKIGTERFEADFKNNYNKEKIIKERINKYFFSFIPLKDITK
jgi:hypothetical protein